MTLTHFSRLGARVLAGVAALLVAPGLAAQGGSGTQNVPPAAGRTAGPAIELTVEDAVRRALEHNPDLAVVRLGIDVDTARVSASRSAYVPVFGTTVGRSSNTTPPTNFLLGVDGVDTTELFSSVGIRQRFRRGGGVWSVSWDASRIGTNSTFSSFDPSLQSGLQVALSQPLFRDRKIDAPRVQYVIAQRNVRSSELRFQESVVQTVAAVKQAYWTLKASLAAVTVQQRSLELAEDLVRQNRTRVEVGQAPPLDLVQAEAEVASRRENLIRTDAAAKDAEDKLRRLIMDPNDATFWQTRLDPIDAPAARQAPPDVDQAIGGALKDRYDLAIARHDLDNAQTSVDLHTNQKLPDVRIDASYRGGGAGGTQLLRSGAFPGDVTGRLTTGFNDVLGQVFKHDFATWSVGMTVSYPLGRSFEEANLARAEIERRQATHRIASLQLEVAETIRQAARQVQSTSERMEAARAGEKLAEQRLTVEQRRFEAGLSTTFLVTQAQRDLLQAQVNLLQSMLDHQSSVVNFDAVQLAAPATGQVVGLRGADVVLIPTPTPQGIFGRGGS